MITVNLLPYELRPIKRTPVPYIAAGLLAVLVMLVIASMYLGAQSNIRTARATLQQNQTELESLQDIVQEHNELVRKTNALAEQVETIEEITNDRIIWSQQLHNLSRLAEENLWYSGIRVTMQPFQRTRTEVDPKTKKTKRVQETVKKQVLTISGYVMPGEDGRAQINPFIQKLATDEEFSRLFEIESPTVGDTEFQDVPVREFELEYVVNANTTGGPAQ